MYNMFTCSLLLRFTDDTFDPEQSATIGNDYIHGLLLLTLFSSLSVSSVMIVYITQKHNKVHTA